MSFMYFYLHDENRKEKKIDIKYFFHVFSSSWDYILLFVLTTLKIGWQVQELRL